MININLIAERRNRKLREASILRMAGLGVLLVLLAMVVLNMSALYECHQRKSAIASIDATLSKQQAEQRKLQNTIAQINQLKPVITLVTQARISEGAWMTILADLGRVIPNDAVLKAVNPSLTGEAVSLRLTGSAKDQKTVGDFMELLASSTRWAKLPVLKSVNTEAGKGIRLPSGEELTMPDRVRFDFVVPVKGLIGGEL